MNPLSKVFSIIETVVAGQDNGVNYSEIVATLDLPKSTVHRILKDLTELGYLNFNPETKKYFGSLHLAALGAEVMAHFKLRDHVRPHLLEMHRETEFTTNMGILDGTMGVFLEKIESRDFGIKLFSEIGKTFPLHCTGLGKALLAFSSEDTVNRLLEHPFQALTEKTITVITAADSSPAFSGKHRNNHSKSFVPGSSLSHVDPSALGDQTVTYSVSDLSGNNAMETRTVSGQSFKAQQGTLSLLFEIKLLPGSV